jgi:hypothetical protein
VFTCRSLTQSSQSGILDAIFAGLLQQVESWHHQILKFQRHPGLWEPGENRSLRTTCANINFTCECDQLQFSSLKIIFHTKGQNPPDAGTTMFLEALLLLAPSESSPKSTTPRRHPATCFHISKASTIKDDCIVVRNDSPVVSCHGRCSTICQTVSFRLVPRISESVLLSALLLRNTKHT